MSASSRATSSTRTRRRRRACIAQAAINHARVGAQKIWAGTVTIHPNAKTGVHHHGALESVIYVVRGNARMRWGDQLEFVAEAEPGDFIYVPPFVPHQEINASPTSRSTACWCAATTKRRREPRYRRPSSSPRRSTGSTRSTSIRTADPMSRRPARQRVARRRSAAQRRSSSRALVQIRACRPAPP